MSGPPARILLVTSGPLSRNPRVWKEALTLGQAGYEVTVFTVANQAKAEAYDAELLRAAPFRKAAIDHLARDVAGRLGSFWDRGLTWFARRSAPLGGQFAAAFGPVARMRRRARRHRADLTIVHTELGLAVGAELLGRGRRVAADIEDWHSHDLLPAAQRARPLRLLSRIERRMLQQCVYTTTTSRSLAAALGEAYAAPLPRVVRNVFPLQPRPPERPPGGPLTFFWFSQTVGPGRMIELFLAAWAQTSLPSQLCLLGDVRADYKDKLARRLPAEKRGALIFRDLVPPWELPAAIARHDVGLALEAGVPDSRNLTITNKFFQYLDAGLPVLATPTAGQREVLDECPGIGWVMDLTQTTAAAAQLDRIIARPEQVRSMGRAAREAAERRYCWERESVELLRAVREAGLAPP